MPTSTDQIQQFADQQYKWGFETQIASETIPKGLNEDVVRLISQRKNEPDFMLQWRPEGLRPLENDDGAESGRTFITHPSTTRKSFTTRRPNRRAGPRASTRWILSFSRCTRSSACLCTSERCWPGSPVDAVFDSVSVATTFREKLAEMGIIFCSMSEALQKHPDLVKKYLGTVVPSGDNFFCRPELRCPSSDGSFCYVPKGVRCPMELSTYFRINAKSTGQFERTLIVADEGAHVSYLEGCTAPMRDENQLHAAVVELVAMENATIKYSTVQNWYPGDKEGKGGIYNFVTKRGLCKGKNSKITWTQVETGSAITWKYPSCILQGDNSVGEFYSVALTNHYQQADTGTKMIHIGKNTRSTIVSKGISAGKGQNTYRGLVKVMPRATDARNYTQCDSLLLGDKCGAHTFPVYRDWQLNRPR